MCCLFEFDPQYETTQGSERDKFILLILEEIFAPAHMTEQLA